jgi:Cytochrome C oxidase, cbb3-type, subunit III
VRKITTGLLTAALIASLSVFAWTACVAEEPAQQAEATAAGGEASAGGDCCKAGDTTPPLDLIKATSKGGLHNPYNSDIAGIVEEGKKKYLSFSCNGCHGGGGGGGMCPPLTNPTWVYGGDDDTLFRLIALGTDELKKQDYTRVKSEIVTGPMPPFGTIIKTSDDLWKVIAFIRSANPDSMALVDKPYQ